MSRPLALALTLSAVLAAPLQALTPMTAEEFDAYSVGKTLTYAIDGTVYGIEQYLPDRRVVWAFTGDQCRHGLWYEEAGKICFVYEHDPDPQCWSFYATPEGLAAVYENDPSGSPLVEVDRSDQPLICPGPDVGA
jgi:hypothetical protein